MVIAIWLEAKDRLPSVIITATFISLFILKAPSCNEEGIVSLTNSLKYSLLNGANGLSLKGIFFNWLKVNKSPHTFPVTVAIAPPTTPNSGHPIYQK